MASLLAFMWIMFFRYWGFKPSGPLVESARKAQIAPEHWVYSRFLCQDRIGTCHLDGNPWSHPLKLEGTCLSQEGHLVIETLVGWDCVWWNLTASLYRGSYSSRTCCSATMARERSWRSVEMLKHLLPNWNRCAQASRELQDATNSRMCWPICAACSLATWGTYFRIWTEYAKSKTESG